MAARDSPPPPRTSFSRSGALHSRHLHRIPGTKFGPNGTMFVSSGIPDLDKILGGGFAVGSLVMVEEDAEAPHHLLLLRNFMSQGIVQFQPLLYACPSREPMNFLGTLPNPGTSDKSRDPETEKKLRIAWQYKKYLNERMPHIPSVKETDYSDEFDQREVLEGWYLKDLRSSICCVPLLDRSHLSDFRSACSTFFPTLTGANEQRKGVGRIAIHSLGSPFCDYSTDEWMMASFMRALRIVVRSLHCVALVTIPPTHTRSTVKRLEHMADTLISMRAIRDGDVGMGSLVTGYDDMVGLVHIHKIAHLNTHVPFIMEAHAHVLKLHKRRYASLSPLNQAPVSSGPAVGSSSSPASLDF